MFVNNEIIQIINKKYVANDCVQVMFTYDKSLAIIRNDNKIIFYDNMQDSQNNIGYINEYVKDERRKQFPYSNIPIHTKRILFKKYNVVNQLLNYNRIYKIIRENKGEAIVMYCKALKDKDSAIVIQGLELSSIFYMKVDELKHLKIDKTPEPNISKRLNKGFSESEIEQSKNIVETIDNDINIDINKNIDDRMNDIKTRIKRLKK